MSNIALNAVSVTLGIFFVFFGCLKLAPVLSEELYRDMSSRVYPFIGYFRINPSPHFVRRMYGSLELVGGTLLVSCPGLMRDLSNVMLLVLMLFDLYNVWMLEEGLKEASHAIVFGLLLVCRVIIRLQINKDCLQFVNKHMNMKHSKTCKYDKVMAAASKIINEATANGLVADDPKSIETLLRAEISAEEKKNK